MIEVHSVVVGCPECGLDHEVDVEVTIGPWNEPEFMWEDIGDCDVCGAVMDTEDTRRHIENMHLEYESEIIKAWQSKR